MLPFTLLRIFVHSLWRVQAETSGDTWKHRGVTGLIQGGLNAGLSKGKKLCPVYGWSCVEWHFTKLRGAYWPECNRTSRGGWGCGSPSLWSGTLTLYLWICCSRPDSGTEGWDSSCLKYAARLVCFVTYSFYWEYFKKSFCIINLFHHYSFVYFCMNISTNCKNNYKIIINK